MKKILILIALLSLMFTGCIDSFPKNQENKIEKKTHVEIPKDKESCLNAGGEWRVIGISPRESCNLRAGDFGESCNDSDDCEGSCMASLNEDELARVKKHKSVNTVGTCSEWIVIVGCQTFVEDGKVDTITCID